jgi:hypothetical protein
MKELESVPEEYHEQVIQLIKSNDELNWTLLYHLLIGIYDNEEEAEITFRRLMLDYRHSLISTSKLRFTIQFYITCYEYKYDRI